MSSESATTNDERLRDEAIARLKKKREFFSHLLAYVLVNSFLIVIWALSDSGFFWPVFPMFGWGIGLVFHAWDTFGRGPTDEQIRREMERIASDGHLRRRAHEELRH